MTVKMDKPLGVIIAGVGGQGALTIAQLVLGAAWRAGLKVLQSEVHGMSQRGGAVNAHVIFDNKDVSSPIIMEGTGDILIAMEPLESLRYLPYLRKDAEIIVSTAPIKNMATYPDEKEILNELKTVDGAFLIDTNTFAKELNYRQAGNMLLLGKASNYMPFDMDHWKKVIAERFNAKGEDVIEKNIQAFEFGRNLN